MQQLTDNIYVVVILAMVGTFLIVSILLYLHAYNRNRLLQQQQLLQQTEIAHQKKLMLAIFASQEEERRRIGTDLHDSVGATLSSLRLIISSIPAEKAESCKTMIDQIITDVRHIAHNISPAVLNLYGLSEAVEELADKINQAGRISVSTDNQVGTQLDQLPHAIMLSLYRVLEELLNNTIRHANATAVRITFLEEGDRLILTYADDGKGLPPEIRKGMGLASITNRLEVAGAAWQFGGVGQAGFAIRIELPKAQNNP
ncbi:ATP-binding protein [uncultured Chitinophaga sp.]|jgi:Signal transduction histidine kinase|uniref:sensor histidine kinase n=1 Tax=uncultured Chitinophaga sp. TaxID=339340 RepID=UPI0026225F7A|nr:ATP-binding protein [uncultured Chitinophaga sp.]